nr:DNA cytosine methyltransferase [uncultured Fusobacterium sp.]
MKVIDLFCGCGGLSEGFKLAGFEIIGGIDINSEAIETYNHNFKTARGVCKNLIDVTEEEIKTEFSDFLKADIIIGGPPCQGFSNANRYKKEEDDERNKLFFEFVKFVDLIQPKFIVIENVRGIISNKNGYAKEKIYEIFEERGYQITHKVLNASEFGVPQERYRNFFVMSKLEKFNFDNLKKISEKVTVFEAIGELYSFEKNIGEDLFRIETLPTTTYQKYLRTKDNVVLNHIVKYPAEKVQARIKCVPQGGNWKDIPAELFENNRTNRHSSAYKRLKETSQSVTIDTGNSHSNYFHPIYNRIPTVRESARLQSFSDDFVFLGSRTSQYRQVGNAVPPLLSYAIAMEIKEMINNEK